MPRMACALSVALACCGPLVLAGGASAVPAMAPAASLEAPTAGSVVDPGRRAEVQRRVSDDPSCVYRALRTVLRSEFKEPTKLRVEVEETPLIRLLAGRLGEVLVEGEGGSVDNLKMDRFKIRGRGLQLSLEDLLLDGKLTVRKIDHTDAALTVSEASFNEMFANNSKQLRVKDPEVRMLDGEMQFRGYVRTFLFNSRIEARGPVEIAPDGGINFNVGHLRLAGMIMPSFVARNVANQVNPIAAFTRLKVWKTWNMQVSSIVVRPGSLTMSGFPEDAPQAMAATPAPAPAAATEPCPLAATGRWVAE